MPNPPDPMEQPDHAAHAERQAALAQAGQIALSNATLVFIFTYAAQSVCSILGADYCDIYKQVEGHLLLVGGAGWRDGTVGSFQAALHAGSQAGYTMEVRQPVIVTDLHTESRFSPGPLYADNGVKSGLSVIIDAGEDEPWGVIGAHVRQRHSFTASDVEFMRALAATLGQAIERRRAEVELRVRAVQQSAIAELGQRVLTSDVDQNALERVCELVMEGLGVEFSLFLEADPNGEHLKFRAGHRWISKPAEAFGLNESHAGATLKSGEPIVVADYEQDRRFAEAVFVQYGIRCGLCVPVMAPSGQFGVLTAQTRSAKRFTDGDVHFMQSLAAVLAHGLARAKANRELVESEQRFRSVVEGASEIIFSLSPAAVVLSLNPAFEAITGWRCDEWIGRNFEEMIVPEQSRDAHELFVSILSEPRSARTELHLRSKKGGEILVSISVSPKIVRGEVIELYGFARDVTEERRLEVQLEQAHRLTSLGHLAATVAHEFNNVLMGIAPFAEVLRREVLSERAQTAVEQISRSVKRGKRITEDILRFTQPAEPVVQTFDATTWIHTVAYEARSLLGPKYSVAVDVPGQPVRIVGDGGQLHQSLINLIVNARDAMPEGGPIWLRIVRHDGEAHFDFGVIERPERFAHFIVEDRGHGIRPEIMRHIFEPLFTTKKTGTGLGLPVTRHVVKRHGGEIFVESTIGAGTKFHIFIPMESREKTESGAAAPAPKPAGDRRYRRILLVEDERAVATGLAALLETEGLNVEIVENGRDVPRAIEEKKPDAVVLDIGLPDMDGTKVFDSIARTHPDLPVVFSSGHADQSKLEKYLAEPRVGFLLKPYDLDALLATLDRVVS